jgi:uncharacterized protein YjbI with pentapeptide repeats
MNGNELIQRYTSGEKLFIGLKLPGVNLSGADLIGIVLREADLHGANLLFAYLNLLG